MAPSPSLAKRPSEGNGNPGKAKKAKRTKREKNVRAGGSSGDVLDADVLSLLRNANLVSQNQDIAAPEPWTEVTVTIETLSSTGEGLGRTDKLSPHIIVVPFSLPGDVVVAKLVTKVQDSSPYIKADLVKVLEPSQRRNDSLVKCRYFGRCSGCQLQMLPYEDQLAHKKTVVEKAYRNFSRLAPHLVPSVDDTMGSPLQYGYRTKLTPHFNGPRFARKLARKGERAYFDEIPAIGFNQKQMPKVIDIEECPISTKAVQMGLLRERDRVKREIANYSKGATLLLRESTEKLEKSLVPPDVEIPGIDEGRQVVYEFHDQHVLAKTCITDHKAIFTEYMDRFRIQNSANSFFQNNNSILSAFLSYIRSQVHPSSSNSNPKNLIDAYSGCGLFSITLCSLFERTIGIDIDQAAIVQARSNVLANRNTSSNSRESRSGDYETTSMPSDGAASPRPNFESRHPAQASSTPEFFAADASQLFASVKAFRPEETVIILDPPRKGCDESFLAQLLEFGPERIIYVSCNVHTQASDVGMLVTGRANPVKQSKEDFESSKTGMAPSAHDEDKTDRQPTYRLESLKGFDFFPQTSHVESVAVLSRVT